MRSPDQRNPHIRISPNTPPHHFFLPKEGLETVTRADKLRLSPQPEGVTYGIEAVCYSPLSTRYGTFHRSIPKEKQTYRIVVKD